MASVSFDGSRPGDLIAGKYRVERILATGGMGIIVAAHHTSLPQRVAVKFLLPAMLTLPNARERFLREAKAAASIRSDHVAQIFDVGVVESGVPYMVMEYLAGVDLHTFLNSHGPIPAEEAVDYV